MKTTVSLMVLTFSLNVIGAEWFVATNGTSSGTGTIDNPWDLQTALNKCNADISGPIHGNDTIWLRGGNYFPYTWPTNRPFGMPMTNLYNSVTTSQFPFWSAYTGYANTNRFYIRSYSNEWAKIDRPWLFVYSENFEFHDVELFDSAKGLAPYETYLADTGRRLLVAGPE